MTRGTGTVRGVGTASALAARAAWALAVRALAVRAAWALAVRAVIFRGARWWRPTTTWTRAWFPRCWSLSRAPLAPTPGPGGRPSPPSCASGARVRTWPRLRTWPRCGPWRPRTSGRPMPSPVRVNQRRGHCASTAPAPGRRRSPPPCSTRWPARSICAWAARVRHRSCGSVSTATRFRCRRRASAHDPPANNVRRLGARSTWSTSRLVPTNWADIARSACCAPPEPSNWTVSAFCLLRVARTERPNWTVTARPAHCAPPEPSNWTVTARPAHCAPPEPSNWTVTAHVGGCGARESLAPAWVQRWRVLIGGVCSAHRPLTRLRLLPGRSGMALLRRLSRLTGVTIRRGLRCLALLDRLTVLTLSVHLAHLPRRARLRCLSIALLAHLPRVWRLRCLPIARHTHLPSHKIGRASCRDRPW